MRGNYSCEIGWFAVVNEMGEYGEPPFFGSAQTTWLFHSAGNGYGYGQWTTRPTEICMGRFVPIAANLPSPLDHVVNNLQAAASGMMRAANEPSGEMKMKPFGYFFLLCGLLNAAAWGQSARKNQAFVIRCAGLSCSASSVAGRDYSEVKIGTFKTLLMVTGIRPVKHDVKLGTFTDDGSVEATPRPFPQAHRPFR